MVKPLTEAEENAIYDYPGTVNPHPDGQPWPRCCGQKNDKSLSEQAGSGGFGCQCVMRKPPGKPSRCDIIMQGGSAVMSNGTLVDVSDAHHRLIALHDEKGRFFCVHRKTDDGYHRECAGWYAKYGRDR